MSVTDPAGPLLRVTDLVIEFDTPAGRRRVVDGVSFSVGEGEVLGILGESGSGKTMSTLAVLGLVHGRPGVVGGQIELRLGEERHALLDGLPEMLSPGSVAGSVRKDDRRWERHVHRRMRGIWGRGMTAVFQNPKHSLDPLMTIGRQLEESVRLSEPFLRPDAAGTRAIDWLAKVKLTDPARVHRSYAHELSGGMCQRAMIAIAIARLPQLLIADEPTTGLDTTVRAEIVELFRDLMHDRQRAMLYISHDIREVLYLADRVMVMRQGRIVEEASASDLERGVGRRHPYTATLLQAADLPVGEAA